MQALRPAAKIGIVAGGLLAAVVAAWVAVALNLYFQPADQASSGMQAFGDLLLGVAVFGVLALGPLMLALYWLRPITRFWTALTIAAVLFTLTGPLAVVMSGWLRDPAGDFALLADARIGLMPLTALAMATCGLFAPQTHQRWILIVCGLVEGALFVAVILVKFVLPQV